MAKLLRAAGLVLLILGGAQAAPAQDEERSAALRELQQSRRNGPQGQREVYELGKRYLEKYGDRPLDEADAQIATYVRRWVARYELALRKYSRRVLPELPRGARPACRRSDTVRGLSSTR